METRRGRPPKVEKAPKDGDAWVQVSITFGGITETKILEVKDYAGSVPGPLKNARSIVERMETIIKDIFGAVRDVS